MEHTRAAKNGKGGRYLVGRSVGVVRRDEQRDGVKREEEDGRPLFGEEPLVLLFAFKKINKNQGADTESKALPLLHGKSDKTVPSGPDAAAEGDAGCRTFL